MLLFDAIVVDFSFCSSSKTYTSNKRIVMCMKPLLKTLAVIMMATACALGAAADVIINADNFPDDSFRDYLNSLYPNGCITTAELNARTELDVSSKGITSLKGVEFFTQLTKLLCHSNRITSLDLSQNPRLTYLNAGRNELSSIDVSANSELEVLYLHSNQLTTLEAKGNRHLRQLRVQNNPSLKTLWCENNALTNLNVTSCTALSLLVCYGNPNLASITGLGSCRALANIDCEDCAITSLDALRDMPQLKTLYCSYNQLITLDLSGMSQLEELWVNGNERLTTLTCRGDALTNLEVGGCVALTTLDCSLNPELTAITDLADCVSLEALDCSGCALTALDGVSGKARLRELRCEGNQLAALNVQGCDDLRYLSCYQNKLAGNAMTNMMNGLPLRLLTHRGELYVLYSVDEGNEVTQAQAQTAIDKNWSPYIHTGGSWTMIAGMSLDQALNVEGGSIHFSSTGEFPWKIIEDEDRTYAQSGNAGIGSSSSALRAVVSVTENSVLSFDFKARGEGSAFDKCVFTVDGEDRFAYGERPDEWENYSIDLEPGNHTLVWSYTKDLSLNPEGDYFAIDNVAVAGLMVITGDVDGDGMVGINDVTVLIDYLLSGDALAVYLSAADVDGDGLVNIADITALIDYLLSGNN